MFLNREHRSNYPHAKTGYRRLSGRSKGWLLVGLLLVAVTSLMFALVVIPGDLSFQLRFKGAAADDLGSVEEIVVSVIDDGVQEPSVSTELLTSDIGSPAATATEDGLAAASTTAESSPATQPEDGSVVSEAALISPGAIVENQSTSTGEVEPSLIEPAFEETPAEVSPLKALFGAVYNMLFGASDEEAASQPAVAEPDKPAEQAVLGIKIGSNDQIVSQKESADFKVVAIIREGKPELWINYAGQIDWQKLADEETISDKPSFGISDRLVFWLSADNRAVTLFDTTKNLYTSQTIESTGKTKIRLESEKYILSDRDGFWSLLLEEPQDD